MKTHAQLRKEVQKWFEDRGAYVVPQNSQGYGRKGVPDLLVCWNGRFLGVEVKVGKDDLKPWQRRELYGDGKSYCGVIQAAGEAVVVKLPADGHAIQISRRNGTGDLNLLCTTLNGLLAVL